MCQNLVCIIFFTQPCNVGVITLLYVLGDRMRLSNLTKVTHPASVRLRMWNQVCFIPECLPSTLMLPFFMCACIYIHMCIKLILQSSGVWLKYCLLVVEETTRIQWFLKFIILFLKFYSIIEYPISAALGNTLRDLNIFLDLTHSRSHLDSLKTLFHYFST